MIERTRGIDNNEFLSDNQKLSLSTLAEEISNYYFPEGIIYPEKIAADSGITFSYGNYGDAFDGLIECLSHEFHIYVNIDRLVHSQTTRARFTFAHELGHYFIDHHRNALKIGRSPSHCSKTGFVSRNLAEREADFFASCLLLPETRFKMHCHKRIG
jgi:Zn-dependent peptidase ImmA (M78 family)